MSGIIFIGVDDTDVRGSPGTGKIARGLAQYLADSGLGISLGVSRHQLLVSPLVKYTSHNSSKGIALRTDKATSAFYQPCISYLESCFQPGADPGLCICDENQATDDIVMFGQKAETTVLSKKEAMKMAAKNSILLRELGGDGSGVIGALAAVGLRASGNDGRLVDLRGVREVRGTVSVAEIKHLTAIESVQDSEGRVVGDNELIHTLNWIRPSLAGGKAVLRVRRSQQAGRRIWLPAEKRPNREHKEDS
jgi:hypothetical protein